MHNDPTTFEDKWHSIMVEYNVVNNKWLSDMFEMRRSWIPSYFRKVELCGLMRTTSRSESENSFFGNFLDDRLNLMLFMDAFEAAIEKQRHTQSVLDHQSSTSKPKGKTPLPIEEHAWNLYTRNLFYLVQDEIYQSVWTCSQRSVSIVDGIEVCIVREKRDHNVNQKKDAGADGDREGEEESQVVCTEKDFEVNCNASSFLYSIMIYLIHRVFKGV